MFEIGDYIVYGNNGVCKIESVGVMDSPIAQKDEIYYTLCPFYTKGSKIFTPANNSKVVMRRIITKKEAMDLIEAIQNIDCLSFTDKRRREIEYKDALKKCDCKELIRIIKTIYLLKQERLNEGKKITAGDEKFFHMAEENLYGELAIALELDKIKVKEYIIDRIENLQAI